jgi:sRNA-binding carbon storage regulator CsrA
MLVVTLVDNEKIFIGDLVVSAVCLKSENFLVSLENYGIKFYTMEGAKVRFGDITFFFKSNKSRIRISIDAPQTVNILRAKVKERVNSNEH